MTEMREAIAKSIRDHLDVAARLSGKDMDTISAMTGALIGCLGAGGTVFWCGNGGSAADSQHMAAELVGRYKRERAAMSSAALTTDTSILTAIGNDYGYEHVFSRQLEARARRGDLLMALSTSGNSENVLQAVRKARSLGVTSVGLLGRDGGRLKSECDLSLVIPSDDTARVQEMHLMVEHILCDLVEAHFA